MEQDVVDKVLLIAGDLSVRGSVTYTLNLAKGLRQRGCEPLLVARGGAMAGTFEQSGIKVDRTDNLGKPIYDLFAFRRYLRSIAAEGFKLVHVQSHAQLRQGLRAGKVLDIPVVLTVHHFLEPGETLRFSKKYLRGVLAVSQAVREDLVNNAKVPRELVRVASTGIDLEAAAACRRGARAGHVPVVGTVGMLTRVKGNEFFLKAAREVLDKGHKVHFVVAGKGEENARLRKQARELGLTRDLTFVTDFAHNYEVLSALDIFVTPSLREGLGITVLQAMACSLPTVSTASGGIHSFVKDGETGVMVPQRDHSAIAAAIIRLIEDREFAIRIASNASEMARRDYPLDKMVNEVLEFYSEIVQGWNRPETA